MLKDQLLPGQTSPCQLGGDKQVLQLPAGAAAASSEPSPQLVSISVETSSERADAGREMAKHCPNKSERHTWQGRNGPVLTGERTTFEFSRSRTWTRGINPQTCDPPSMFTSHQHALTCSLATCATCPLPGKTTLHLKSGNSSHLLLTRNLYLSVSCV